MCLIVSFGFLSYELTRISVIHFWIKSDILAFLLFFLLSFAESYAESSAFVMRGVILSVGEMEALLTSTAAPK